MRTSLLSVIVEKRISKLCICEFIVNFSYNPRFELTFCNRRESISFNYFPAIVITFVPLSFISCTVSYYLWHCYVLKLISCCIAVHTSENEQQQQFKNKQTNKQTLYMLWQMQRNFVLKIKRSKLLSHI